MFYSLDQKGVGSLKSPEKHNTPKKVSMALITGE